MARRAYTDDEVEAAVQALSQPERLDDAQRVVSDNAPALQRMQRPGASHLDLDLAREIALREGIKAIVDGDVRQVGRGYIVTLRLVGADSAQELASYRATADGTQELLDALDKLTRRLRGKIGEEFSDIRHGR